jgi:hypothetical protein
LAQWRGGPADPNLAFSIQLYHAIRAADLRLVVLTEHPAAVAQADDFATFVPIEPPSGSGATYHWREIALARRIAAEFRRHRCSGLIKERMMQHLWPLRGLMKPPDAFVLASIIRCGR